MKRSLGAAIVGLVIALAAVYADARSTSITGYGFAGRTCYDYEWHWCVRDNQDRAERDAAQDAQWSCQVQNGRLQVGYKYCNTSCNPFSLRPGEKSDFVSCNAHCRFSCEFQD